MIPTDRADVFAAGLTELEEFARATGIRGRFVAIYLGLRRLGSELPSLGASNGMPTGVLEQSLDDLFTKSNRSEPFVVLTAPFGGSTSPNAPYSTRTGVRAPGHSYPTNTWRNNFGIQKGIGCPAEPTVIRNLLDNPIRRLACPHMAVDPEGRYLCQLQGTNYRGEEHSIWLRMTDDGYQSVDLDHPAVWEPYLRPAGRRIPIFPLIAGLYSFAPAAAYPTRTTVGIPDFAADFHFDLADVEANFQCDPDDVANARLLAAVSGSPLAPPAPAAPVASAPALPVLNPAGELNNGIGAELAVANELIDQGWNVVYRGNQRGFGYDLEADRAGDVIRVEVKSSVGFTTPELLETEWSAAQRHGESFVLAVVDFYGSAQQAIWYVRDPANTAFPVARTSTIYRLVRTDVQLLGTEVDFL
ncbi:MAG TPA: DUF3883 domain-containing protein [Gaiellaceae bacterium]|nr:DUF3883 domain-containing protein [Gaiellaceae bacterium]